MLEFEEYKIWNNKRLKIIKPKNIYRLSINLMQIIFLIIGRNLYLKSLAGCNGDEFTCVISNLKNVSGLKRIGYPITIGDKEEIVGRPAMYSDTLLEFVSNNLINMDNGNLSSFIGKKKPEVILDYTKDPYGKLIIEINYNETLSNSRKKKEINNDSNNILFIFLDNLSRVHFYRQYKKVSQFLKKFLRYEGYSSQNTNQIYHGFEFMKYHKFQGATIYNAIPMFSGVDFSFSSRMVSIVKDLKHLGYITCNVQDICHKELMSINGAPNYTYIEFDHEYAATNCDPNVYKYGFGLFDGENSMLRKCLYGKESFEYSLEYGRKFWEAYQYNKKFLRIVNTYAHEYSGVKSRYTDDLLYNFLNGLYSDNLLENTTVFIAGDHGFALMGIYKLLNSSDWEIEISFPIFILIIPDKKNSTYNEQYKEILENQQTLITPFDIFFTLRHIIYGNNYKENLHYQQRNKGESLFKYINPKNRTCKRYINFGDCQCKTN